MKSSIRGRVSLFLQRADVETLSSMGEEEIG
jgi:hypothetical protein